MPTAQQYQTLIINQIGDEVTPDYPGGVIAANVDVVWETHADKSPVLLQFQWSKLDCIGLVIPLVRKQVTFNEAGRLALDASDRFKALVDMQDACREQIAMIIKRQVSMAQTVSVGQLKTPVPDPIVSALDRNDPRYKGDIYSGSWLPGRPL